MRAVIFEGAGKPLVLKDVERPEAGPDELLLEVAACGVCRTDLHILEGDLAEPVTPLIPGHQIVGRIVSKGARVDGFEFGQRVGVPWLGGSCGHCRYCRGSQENLCDEARYTGYQINGGFAEYATANARYCFPVPEDYPDLQAAPLLCAGLIGYRSLMMTGTAKVLGFYGFGAAAHILIQVARFQGQQVCAFTRPGDTEAADFARDLGAIWAGGSDEPAPVLLDAAIIFAPVGGLVPIALRAVRKGGVVVCAGIHMSDIPTFPYADLWGERAIRSVANLTRADGEAFMALAPRVPVRTEVHAYPLAEAGRALEDLRGGVFTGSAVIVP